MWKYIKQGWRLAWKQPFLFIVLFLYQWAWGVVLYRFVRQIIEPVLHRYPGGSLSGASVTLFYAESEFRLLKTDLSFSYLWWLCALLLLRMLLTPVLKAGILFSLHQTNLNSGYRFFLGMKKLSKAFIGYYIIQIGLTLLPLYWLLPFAAVKFKEAVSYTELLWELLPYTIGMLGYGCILHLLCLYVMLQRTTGERWGRFWSPLLRSIVPMAAVTITILLIGGLASSLATGASFYWAGVTALIIYQLYHFIKIFLNLWLTSSQYQLWMAKAE
jgi:hypothetical protein